MQSTAASRPGATESRPPSGNPMATTLARAGMERSCVRSVKLACGCRLVAQLVARRAMVEATEVRAWVNIHTKPLVQYTPLVFTHLCSPMHSCSSMHARANLLSFPSAELSDVESLSHRIDPSFAAS